jgi:hypothetical protein
MQPDEWIRRRPVAARRVVAVHDHNRGCCLSDERVGERHAQRARADHEVVRLDYPHGHLIHITCAR